MNNYVPLDVCSSYSTGDSICQVPRLVCKGHAVAYAWLAYQSAYLKAHYSEVFADAVDGEGR
jgi:DNA polymerase III alpha subunit